MSFYTENCTNRILELFNSPVAERCPELTLLFDRCSIRDLQDIFLPLMNSIFGINSGSLGWGLRTTTRETSHYTYEYLYQFFVPLGPMFRLCYRLLNDAIKFDFSVDQLPRKTKEMIVSGQYSMFYADLITVDPFRRTVPMLSLNAFDYFMLSFAIHGTVPLHRMYPQALQVHNERLKTTYFWLTADYLCFFMPANPDTVVLPTNICGTVKAPQPMPVQTFQPSRSPKYLKLSPISHFTNSNSSINQRTADSPRAYAWRTESVLYLFVDVWVRFDVDETMELPSSEFIRNVRVLVKQIHAFGNSAEIDNTSMAILRKQAQPMMKARFYPFLKSLIARWPLDSSLTVVLELWLSYIQPWRYTFNRDARSKNEDIPITNKHELFILENLPVYTQIFVHVLPRFERLDFTAHKNVVVISRLVKVFNQANLLNILMALEQRRPNTFNPITRSPSQIRTRSTSFYSPQRQGAHSEWTNLRPDNIFHEEMYTPMFGDAVRNEVLALLKKLCTGRFYVHQEIEGLSKDLDGQSSATKFIRKWFFFEEESAKEMKLVEQKKIPELLNPCINSLCTMFQLKLPDISIEHVEPQEVSYSRANLTYSGSSDNLDISKISPLQMRNAIYNIQPNMDPALLPVQIHECKILVRFLHQVSCRLNEMFGPEMARLWNRNSLFGLISRQILSGPMTIQWFDKSRGYSELKQECLPPRICLRVLASYRTLILIGMFLLVGQFIWSAPSFGLLLLVGIISIYLFLRSLFT